MTRLVASLIPTSVEVGLELAGRAQRAGADMVELRLDYFSAPNAVEALVRGSRSPVLASCRVREDGGHFGGDLELRRALLLAAAGAGAEWLDLEHWETLCLPPGRRTRVLRSYHRWQEPPRDLVTIVDRMAESGADALKVALMGYDAADLEVVLRLYARRYSMPLVAFAMGAQAMASRFLALLNGAPFLYCAPSQCEAVAPGQPDLYEARQLYRAPTLGLDSRFWGLIGSPVSHSLGFRLHNGMARHRRDAPVYLPFDTKDPGRLLQALRAFGPRFLGASVTSPHKQKVVALMDELGREAEACGAVNTIVHRDGRLIGENTDVAGLRRALADALPRGQTLKGRRAVVLGGGGSARAACLALELEGARVHLAVRTRQRIRAFADRRGIPLFPLADRTFEALQPEVLVHATTVGWSGSGGAGECLVRREDIQPGSLVLDLVYDPPHTVLLERARQAGARPVSGLSVFVHQALEQAALVLGDDTILPSVGEAALLLGPEGRRLRQGAPEP